MRTNSNSETIVFNVAGTADIAEGALMEIESGVANVYDGTGAIAGIADGCLSGELTMGVDLITRGQPIVAGIDPLITAVSGSTTDTIYFSLSGCPSDALNGAVLEVLTCAGTPAASGQIYTVVDSTVDTDNRVKLDVVGNVSAAFATADTFNIVDLSATNLQGLGISLSSDGVNVDFDGGVWATTDFMVKSVEGVTMDLLPKNTVF